MTFEAVHTLVSRAARRHPRRTAVEGPRGPVGHAELEALSDQVAAELTAAGAASGDFVPVLAEDRRDLIAAVLGVLKIGGVFVPLEPTSPRSRIEDVLADTKARHAVTGSGRPDYRSGLPVATVTVDASRPARVAPFRPHRPAPDDPCCLFYASESTGRLQGVLTRLGDLGQRVRREVELLQVTHEWRVGQLSSPSHEVMLHDFFVSLTVGGTVCVPPAEPALDPAALLTWLDEQRISLLHCVHSDLQGLLDAASRGNAEPAALRFVATVGGRPPAEEVRRWFERYGGRIGLLDLHGGELLAPRAEPAHGDRPSRLLEPPGGEDRAKPPNSPGSAEDRAFWRDILADHPPFTLPESWSHPDESPGENYELQVDLTDLEQPLQDLAARIQAPLRSVLLAAHTTVMSRLTEAPAFHLGLICDTRSEPVGAQQVCDIRLNTVPFPVDRSARTWRELITQVFDREVEVWRYRHHPFSAMRRDGDGGRLVSVAFGEVGPTPPDSAGHETRDDVTDDLRCGVPWSEFDLTVHYAGSRINLSTDTASLRRGDGARLVEQYRAVLEAMIADPEGDARAACLPAAERHILLEELTATARGSLELSVPAEFGRLAAASPHSPAVVTDTGTKTYGRLDSDANRLAHHLRSLGVGPDTVVGVHLERSPELVTSVLAILKAGGAFLPLDTHTPADRLAFMARAAGARVLVTLRGLAGALRPLGDDGTIVELDDPAYATAAATLPDTCPEPLGAPDSLAYVIYTSGSTGRPKGAMLRRDGMGNHLLAKIEDLDLGPADSVAFNAPVSFGVCVWQMLSPLIAGGLVRITDHETALDPGALFSQVSEDSVTVLEVVPSVLRAALDHWDACGEAARLPRLRRLVVTGELLPMDLCRRWFEHHPHVPLVNAYGATEASDDVTHARIDTPPRGWRVPVGRPIRNTRLYVLDARLQPVPTGAPGELYAGGAGVGRGYLGRPDLTAERFVPDPFGPPGSRLYRVGDLAAWRPDGTLDYFGRVDHQVQVHGHRVEPGEIEALLAAHPRVSQAVVVMREGDLVAYVTVRDSRPPTPGELRDHLRSWLPDYMVPATFVCLDTVPLSPHGKVDRHALPDPALADEAEDEEEEAPRTSTEQAVARLWTRMLPIQRVGVRQEFFDVGGRSLQVVRMLTQVREEFGIEIPLRDFLAFPTIEWLAGRLDGAVGAPDSR